MHLIWYAVYYSGEHSGWVKWANGDVCLFPTKEMLKEEIEYWNEDGYEIRMVKQEVIGD